MDQQEGDEIVAGARLRAALVGHIEDTEPVPDEVSERARALYDLPRDQV
ncbi:hypothetical protein [Nonomuraea sp. NPDC050202]